MSFNFKQFRQDKGWTAEEAGQTMFGFAAATWTKLENGYREERQLKIYAKACEIFRQGFQIHTPVTKEQMKTASIEHRLTFIELSKMIGHGQNNWSNLYTGNLPWTKRWVALVNTVFYMLANPEQTEAIHIDAIEPESVAVVMAEPENFEHVRPIIIDGEPSWILADVCRAIDYQNPSLAKNLIDEIDLSKRLVDISKGEQWVTNESGLYQLLISSHVEKAKPFRRWVTNEVLPAIRKTGSYSANKTTPIDAMILSLQEIKSIKEEVKELREATNRAVENQVTTRDVISDLQRLDQKKIRLKDLVSAIVKQAKKQPQGDYEALHFSKYGNVWRAVHRSAQPPVSNIRSYTTLAQIQTAINSAEFLLVKMGGICPVEQLAFQGAA